MNFLKGINANFIKPKFKMINYILLLDIIVLIVVTIIRIFGHSSDWFADMYNHNLLLMLRDQFLIIASISITISFFLLSAKNEKIFTSNNYRLMPISDKELYTKNLLSSFFAEVYFSIVSFLIILVFDIPNTFQHLNHLEFNPDSQLSGLQLALCFLGVLTALVFGILAIWSVMSFFHFIFSIINNFLPFRGKKILRGVFNVLVTWTMIYCFRELFLAIIFIFKSYLKGFNPGVVLSIWTLAIIFIVLYFINYFLNSYLLKRWVETKY